MTVIRWSAIGLLWAGVAWACLQTTQGIYEDHLHMNLALHYDPIFALGSRYFARWSIWAQVRRFGAVPWELRLGSLALSAFVSSLVGVFAWRLGLSAWVATGVMALHPLMIETITTLSGRAELIAALGVVAACACVASPRVAIWRWNASAICLILACYGKETAAIGLVLVPLTWWSMTTRRMWPALLCLIGGLIYLWALWPHRLDGLSLNGRLPSQPFTWAVTQAGAAIRLCVLAIVPIGQTIDFDYDRLSRAWLVLSALSLGALVALAAHLWQHVRVAGLSLWWVLIVIAPRLLVQTPKSDLNENHFYLALVGVALGLATLHQRMGVVCDTVS